MSKIFDLSQKDLYRQTNHANWRSQPPTLYGCSSCVGYHDLKAEFPEKGNPQRPLLVVKQRPWDAYHFSGNIRLTLFIRSKEFQILLDEVPAGYLFLACSFITTANASGVSHLVIERVPFLDPAKIGTSLTVEFRNRKIHGRGDSASKPALLNALVLEFAPGYPGGSKSTTHFTHLRHCDFYIRHQTH